MRVLAYYAKDDLREEEWPKPDPGPGEVRVRIRSVCICGSDLTQYETGEIGGLKTPVPFVLGHEAAGIVDAVGRGVTGLPEGMPVAVEPDIPCGVCAQCRVGRPNTCPHVRFLGAPPVQGALAEFIIMPAANLYPVHAQVGFAEIAAIEPLAIGIYAVRKMAVTPGDTVAIFGVGGIGHVILLAAVRAGARVIAVTDRVRSRLAAAEKQGAESAIDISQQSAVEAIAELTDGRGVDVAFEAAGELDALRDATNATAIGGRVAIVGIPHEDEWCVPAPTCRRHELALQNIRRSNHTTAIAVDWLQRGVVNLGSLVSHRLPWDQAEEAFQMASARAEGTLRISLEPEEFEEPFYQ